MSDAKNGQPTGLITNWKQLLVAGVLAFVVPVLLIIAIVQVITGGMKTSANNPAMSQQAIEARIKPVGEINVAGTGGAGAPVAAAPTATPAAPAAAPAAPAKAQSGSEVYQSVCTACHGAGLAGAPKTGDAAAWKARIAQGKDTLYTHAIQGFKLMPAKGGNTALSDAEVKAAVDYMLAQAK